MYQTCVFNTPPSPEKKPKSCFQCKEMLNGKNKEDKKGGSSTPRKIAIASIECFQEEFDLVDIWRVKNPEIKSFTWCQSSPLIFCRLDYWFISNNLQDWIKSTDIIPALRTDHSAIMLVVDDNKLNHAKGQGFWKMNCAILDDSLYIEEISNLLPKARAFFDLLDTFKLLSG